MDEQTVAGLFPAGGTATVPYTYTTPADGTLGIWWVDYALLDSAGETVQPQAEVNDGRFAVTSPPSTTGTPDEDIWFSVTTTSQEVAFGDEFDYTFHIYNNTDEERKLTIKNSFGHTGRGKVLALTAAPQSETTVTDTELFTDKNFMYETMISTLRDESNRDIAGYQLSFKGYMPSVPGETVTLALSIGNKNDSDFSGQVKVKAVDPDNAVVYENTLDVSLGGGKASTEGLSIALSSDAVGGHYTVYAEATSADGEKAGNSSMVFSLPIPVLAVTPMLPATIAPDATMEAVFEIENRKLEDSMEAVFRVEFVDPLGSVLFSGKQGFTAHVGLENTLGFGIPTGPVVMGQYALKYEVAYENMKALGSETLMREYPVSVDFAEPEYKAGGTLDYTLKVLNAGDFTEEIEVAASVSGLGYSETRTVGFSPGEAVELAYSAGIPGEAQNGLYELGVTLAGGQEDLYGFYIPPPEFSITMPGEPGDGLVVTLENTGGSAADYSLELSLQDRRGLVVAQEVHTGTLTPGSAHAPGITMPENAASGEYTLKAVAVDAKTGISASRVSTLELTGGVEGALSVSTDKDVYASTEGLLASADVALAGAGISDASLLLKVIPALETGTLTGTVLGAETVSGLSGVKVYAGGGETYTTADGGYVLNGVPLGEQEVTFALLGYQKTGASVSVVGGVQTYDLTIEKSSYGRLAGELLDSQTLEPVVGAKVEAYAIDVPVDYGVERYVYSHFEGEFAFETMETGVFGLRITKEGYDEYETQVSVTGDTGDVRISLDEVPEEGPAPTVSVLRGSVIDAVSGEALTGVGVYMDKTEAPVYGAADGVEYTTMREQEYYFGDLEPGEHTLKVQFGGYDSYEATLDVPAGEQWHDIYLEPTRYGTVSGTVTDAETGKAVAFAKVQLTLLNNTSSEKPGRVIYTAIDGTYSISDFPVGEYTMRASRKNYTEWEGTFTLAEGETPMDVGLSASTVMEDQTETEPNNGYDINRNLTSLNRLYLYTNMSGSMSSSDPDYYKTYIPSDMEDGTLYISLSDMTEGSTIKLNVSVPSPYGGNIPVASGEVTAPGGTITVSVGPDSGRIATAVTGSYSSTYTLRADFRPHDDDLYAYNEPNDPGSTKLPFGKTETGYFHNIWDKDRYRVYLSEAGGLIYELEGVPEGAVYMVKMFNSKGHYIYSQRVASPGGTYSKYLGYEGTYYISVSRESGARTDQPYRFRADFSPVVHDHVTEYNEPNGTSGRATVLTDGQTEEGYLWGTGDLDVYRITLPVLSYFKITVEGVPDDDEYRLRTGGTHSSSTYISSPGGTYTGAASDGDLYIDLSYRYGKSTHTPYTVRVDTVPYHMDMYTYNESGCVVLEMGETGTGYFYSSSDTDCFSLALSEPTTVKFSFDGIPEGYSYGMSGINHTFTSSSNSYTRSLSAATHKVYPYTKQGKGETPYRFSITRVMGELPPVEDTIYEETFSPVAASGTETVDADVPAISMDGKYILKGTLSSSSGQEVAAAEYPFYVTDGDVVLMLGTDREIYRPGRAVAITGEARNLSAADITGLELDITQDGQTLYTSTFDLEAGGSHSFTASTTASTDGTYGLLAKVVQHSSTLVEIEEMYEVASPAVTSTVTVPTVVDNDPFDLIIELQNSGSVDAEVSLQSSIENLEMTIGAGENEILQYSLQITEATTYTFVFSGDLEQTVTRTVGYGLAASMEVEASSVYPEGYVELPMTITNTGELDKTMSVEYTIEPGGTTETRTYNVPVGQGVTDTLVYALSVGEYTISAASVSPDASTQATFSVVKAYDAAVEAVLGQKAEEQQPVTVDLTNGGYYEIDGSLWCSVTDVSGAEVWSGTETVTGLVSSTPQTVSFSIGFSTFDPGDYHVDVELLDNANQGLASTSGSFTVAGPVLGISGLPAYASYAPDEEAGMTFNVMNTGDQEGRLELNLKAYDLVDATHEEWLAAGAETELDFAFPMPVDLEEGDYFADYRLSGKGGEAVASGQVKYHLEGIELTVTASLDKEHYAEGETAQLAINVGTASTATLPLIAKSNYAGTEYEEAFTLEGSHTLTVDVPLYDITGEKLFYGIYHETGRSIHLNSLYVYEAGEVLTVTTGKQVYDAGETVSYTVTGTEAGTLTVTADGYTETFEPFSGSASGSFTLDAVMTAGTYGISASLAAGDGETYTETHPYDVDGMEVKVIGCENDRDKYAPVDTISTSYTISSDTSIAATLKTWVLDPLGGYTSAGEEGITLSLTENLLHAGQSSLDTDVAGIHRLVYGIYTGDLLLVSGSESFDVGDAVLLGVSTEKTEYPTHTEPVTVTLSMTGSGTVDVALVVDGETVNSTEIQVDGVTTEGIELSAITPGNKTLEVVLTTGGLKSTREITFAYGSDLPDLGVSGYQTSGGIGRDHLMEFAFNVTNDGRTASDGTELHIHRGDDIIETKAIGALEAGASENVTVSVDVLGSAGTLELGAVVDQGGSVVEFDEDNNTATVTVTVPDAVMFTSTGEPEYRVSEEMDITAEMMNLSAGAFGGYGLRTTVTDPLGVTVHDETVTVSVDAASTHSMTLAWAIPQDSEDGTYSISQYLLSPSGNGVASSGASVEVIASDFSLTFDTGAISIMQGENAVYTGTIEPIGGFESLVSLSLAGMPEGATAVLSPDALVPPGEVALEILTNEGTEAGTHEITVTAEGEGIVHEAVLVLDISAFTVAVDQAEVDLMQLEGAALNVTLDIVGEYSGIVELGVDEVPFGIRATLEQSSAVVPAVVELDIDTSKYTKPGTYEIVISVKDEFVEHTAVVTLNVTANPALAAGFITAEGPGPKNEAWVRVFNGNIEPMLELTAFEGKYGASAASADLDGDGYDEIVVGMGPDPKNKAIFRVFDRSGSLKGEFTAFDVKYGVTLSSGDLDGDWVDELVAGMGPDPKNTATLRVLRYNGYGFGEVASVTAYDTKYGVNTAVGDIDGDNVPEIITAPGPGPRNTAQVKVWALEGATLVEKGGFTAFEGKYGANVATGDIDGDGAAEIIVGTGPDPKNASLVRVFRADGSLVLELTPYGDEYGYGVNVAAADLDGDGVAEIIVGLGPDPKNTSWVKVFRADGSEMAGFLAYPEKTKYGVKVFSGRPGGVN
jgi:hypothetical protein